MIYFNPPYEVVLSACPAEFPIPCYGVLNTVTGMIEAYIGQLARAKNVADQFAKDLRYGIKPEDQALAELMDAMIKKDPSDFGNGGSLNG